MSVSDMQRLRELEAASGRFKRMYTYLSLDHELQKDVKKKGPSPVQRRPAVGWLCQAKATSERQARRVAGQAPTTQRRRLRATGGIAMR